jgi:alkylation response protein AidB-like acyl-CoA dehydrogenase
MDYGDSSAEAEFRTRLRNWLADNTPELPASSTSDEYWHAQGEWHQSLYDAGFFGMSWPTEIGGQGLPSVFDVILDEELTNAHAPPRPSCGYLVHGIAEHGGEEVRQRFLPGIINGRDRWCQGFSEPDAGSDLASLRTRAELDGAAGEYVVTGHKIWTSYSDVADWCLLLARTDPEAPRHKGISAFAIPMDQPGIEQHPIRMINGITAEFGEVVFDGARVPAANMIGEPGDGWRLAMTVVSHEREPGELGVVSRYRKTVAELAEKVAADPRRHGTGTRRDLAWAIVESEMLRLHVARRLSARMDGIEHTPQGSIDRLLMTTTEQTVGHASVAVEGAGHGGGDQTALRSYLYSRAATVMGGTAQIQRNLIATRILDLPN